MAFSLTSCQKTQEYDVLLKDFKLHSPNDAVSSNEGSEFWIAVQDGKIAEIIDITQQTILPKGKIELSLDGQHLYPGFIDARPPFGYAEMLTMVNLVGAQSKEECLERIEKFIELHPNNEWIIGAAGTKTTGP